MDQSPGYIRVNKWVIAMTVMLPTFIEVMDTSVVNVSLPHIQGSLSAGLDEVTWVLTSYLVSNAIIIPITGWLSNVFGRKRYLLFSLVLFTASSVMCGSAPTLKILVLARILQGIGGGGLQPISQAILLESFPQREHGMAMAVFGMGVILAPILGPVVGGWITDNWTWRWVFYINLPVGILAVFLAVLFVHDPPYIKRGKVYIDRWGLFLLTIGLGCLQIVLDKGEREDWFNSHFIVYLSIIAAVALVFFVIVELRTKYPVVDLKVFKDSTFAAGNFIMFTGFFCLFGSIVLLPVYLQKLMGYTAFWAGLVLGPGGIASFLIMPVAGTMMKKGVNPRTLLAVGLAIMAYSLYLMSGFNLQADFMAVSWPRIIQGFGMGLFFVPLAAATFANIPKEKMGNASGIFNLLRNLGGSFGVAFSTTVLSQRSQFHQNFLVEHITPYNKVFQERFAAILHWLKANDPGFASPDKVLAVFYKEVLRQASMLAFNDVFWLFAWFTAFLIPMTFILKKPTGKVEIGGIH
ncbi:MAG TPA: DHA2 family efflux MFS transporter permease subunit [Deltaproteobacteria bacterium]|nr:DHA2 family efflux MFS transporter permease subunit [Deltaproteobacteria bacterium]